MSLSRYIADQFDPGLNWGDIEWMRSRWDGDVGLKVIQTVEDALLSALAKLPADRFASAAEFAEALNGESPTMVMPRGRRAERMATGPGTWVAFAAAIVVLAGPAAWGGCTWRWTTR